MSSASFYDTLSPYYHLIYPDWQESTCRQSGALDAIIRTEGGPQPHTVLDAACGIGTQSLGLAALGYEVTASDLSFGAIGRARLEAQQRNLPVRFSVADMRQVHDHHRRSFDAVLACDNSVAHLLSDEDILAAFRQFFACTNLGGVCVISVRDYAVLDDSGPPQIHAYGVREVAGSRYILFQVWEPARPLYRTTFYVIEHGVQAKPVVYSARTTLYAVLPATLIRLMEQAGFGAVHRLDDAFFQPVIVGRKIT